MSTLEQRRAQFALTKVEGVKTDPNREKFLTELRDLPSRLHTAGLGQTLASLLASKKKNKARGTIYGWLEEWLRKPPIRYPAGRPLIECVIREASPNETQASYLAASREARALSTWLKKFAEAFLEKSDAEGERDDAAAARQAP